MSFDASAWSRAAAKCLGESHKALKGAKEPMLPLKHLQMIHFNGKLRNITPLKPLIII